MWMPRRGKEGAGVLLRLPPIVVFLFYYFLFASLFVYTQLFAEYSIGKRENGLVREASVVFQCLDERKGGGRDIGTFTDRPAVGICSFFLIGYSHSTLLQTEHSGFGYGGVSMYGKLNRIHSYLPRERFSK